MECDKVRDLLPFLDDGSLDQEKVRKVRRHMVRCKDCLNEYNEQVEMLGNIQKAFSQSRPSYSPDFLKSLNSKIKRKKEERVIHRWLYSVAAVFIVALGISLFNYFPGTKPATMSVEETNYDTSAEEFDSYIASTYLNSYEMSELYDNTVTTEEHNFLRTFISNNFADITPEDLIVLASY
ncbi:MAG: zf-HC2 domain-containing protein [Candidatus Latescibacteria bacterium]|nr:zf-HC2 domain-containing protein [Candidatus Latescibacterota bacterium]